VSSGKGGVEGVGWEGKGGLNGIWKGCGTRGSKTIPCRQEPRASPAVLGMILDQNRHLPHQIRNRLRNDLRYACDTCNKFLIREHKNPEINVNCARCVRVW
jgi:hypothetical protein